MRATVGATSFKVNPKLWYIFWPVKPYLCYEFDTTFNSDPHVRCETNLVYDNLNRSMNFNIGDSPCDTSVDCRASGFVPSVRNRTMDRHNLTILLHNWPRPLAANGS